MWRPSIIEHTLYRRYLSLLILLVVYLMLEVYPIQGLIYFNLESLESRRIVADLMMFQKIVKLRYPVYFMEDFELSTHKQLASLTNYRIYLFILYHHLYLVKQICQFFNMLPTEWTIRGRTLGF